MAHEILHHCPLEDLPSLVRHELLQMLSLAELYALVHASPIFHQQYRDERTLILARCLDSTLGSISIDAYATHQPGLAAFKTTRSPNSIRQYLKSYSVNRSSKTHPLLNEDDAIAMAAFHRSIVNPLREAYTQWSLGNLVITAKQLALFDSKVKIPDSDRIHAALSPSENLRVLRGIYRFQLCCNLFGALGRGRTSHDSDSVFDPVEILNIFFCLFEPWEVEEVACIYAFFKSKISGIFDEISPYVDEKSPVFDGQSIPSIGARNLRNSWTRDNLLAGTISRGLRLMHTILLAPKDQGSLVSIMQRELSWGAGCFLDLDAFNMRAQWDRRVAHPTDRDAKEDRRDPLPFNGDGESDENNLRPPLAWVILWGGTYSNLFGDWIGDALRMWGYVMWDRDRMGDTGADKMVSKQWQYDNGGDFDPREHEFDDEDEGNLADYRDPETGELIFD